MGRLFFDLDFKTVKLNACLTAMKTNDEIVEFRKEESSCSFEPL
jgi:hypothetical protein